MSLNQTVGNYNLVSCIVNRQLPIFYLDTGTFSENDRERIMVIHSLSFSELYLKNFTTDLPLKELEQKYRLTKLCDVHHMNPSSNYLNDVEFERDPFYEGKLCFLIRILQAENERTHPEKKWKRVALRRDGS
jgi:hypothetical protein